MIGLIIGLLITIKSKPEIVKFKTSDGKLEEEWTEIYI